MALGSLPRLLRSSCFPQPPEGLRARPALERCPRAPELREPSPAEAGRRSCIHPTCSAVADPLLPAEQGTRQE